MIKYFLSNESGAVTVDWVVLTAGLVGLGLATTAVVSAGVQDLSGDTSAQLEDDGIITTSFATAYGTFSLSDYTRLSTGYDGNLAVYSQDISGYSDVALADQLALYSAAATDPSASAASRAWAADVYARAYNEAQNRDYDLSGNENPQAISDAWTAQFG